MAHLDDQNGRPAQPKFLDLSSLKPQTKEEVQNALYKIPEMKLRPEKILEDEDDVLVPHSWRRNKEYPYLNPVPSSMHHVNIQELSKVDIDWKMLTLDRPETALEIQIFSRIVYLSKVTVKCIAKEKAKKEKAQSVRLRMLGKFKIAKESDNTKIEELTYEFFSRNFGTNDRGQAMEDIPKPPTADAPKVPPSTAKAANEVEAAKDETTPKAPGSKKRKTHMKKRKVSKKKKSKKKKVSKREIAGKKTLSTAKAPKTSSKRSSQKWKVKSSTNGVKSSKKKCDSSGKTLVQMLKAKEKAERKQKKGHS